MREGRRLDGIIADLFWLARHDEDHLETESVEVDLDDLLYEEATPGALAERTRRRHVGGRADARHGRPGDVETHDPQRRRQRDALRPQKSWTSTRTTTDDEAVIFVSDDGEGIDVERERSILRALRRVPTRRAHAARAARGSGSPSSPRSRCATAARRASSKWRRARASNCACVATARVSPTPRVALAWMDPASCRARCRRPDSGARA